MASHGVPRSSTTVRTPQAIQADLLKIEAYNNLVSEVQALKSKHTYSPTSLSTTSSLLTQNPEFNTIWNFRRRIVLHLLLPTSSSSPTLKDDNDQENDKLSLLSSELNFLFPLLQKFPKCYWIWNYRVFILQTASTNLSLQTALKLWKSEMGLVNKMLSRDSRNFHGWGYRRYIVQNIETLQKDINKETTKEKEEGEGEEGVDGEEEEESLAEQEFAYTTTMYGKDLSNFSAWHNRSKLIPRVLSERGATIEERRTFLDGELGEMQTAVYTDPYDQSIQLYNHWLLLESCSSKQTTSTSPVFSLTNSQKLETLSRTLEWMRELLDEEPDCRLLLEEMIFVGSLFRDLDETEEEEDVDREEIKRDMQSWLEKLMEVDPMRGGRWREMQEKL
ncbi:Rab geranylgeranyltransferase [Orbilia oligospora]|uniref:Geranylgeranyl transferase type-2 subunit alpha n=1 Tax=Orbilia oligospora TaxID=2813651 RepID=A0A7C8VQJ7_ORBOL|nr:Rab geranylgeranyltransferase [Orbilia oligospora]